MGYDKIQKKTKFYNQTNRRNGGEYMRLKLFFKLENNIIDVQYRKGIISWIKHAIQEYDKNLFNQIYSANQKKTFTFAPILSNFDYVFGIQLSVCIALIQFFSKTKIPKIFIK